MVVTGLESFAPVASAAGGRSVFRAASVPPWGTMASMETPAADTLPSEYGQPSRERRRPAVISFPLVVAAVLFLTAAVSQFVIGPATSPGFTYLAVVCTLAGIGALLSSGLKAYD
jgi:hypothetical protein